MRFAIIGAGSMGSVFGGKLCRSGFDVAFFDHDAVLVAVLRENGLAVRDPNGVFTVNVFATNRMTELREIDCAIILVDSAATADVALHLSPILSANGFALTLQNGIGNIEVLIEHLGDGRVLGGSTYVSAAMIAPAHAHNTNIGETILGELDGAITLRVREVASHFVRAGFPSQTSENIRGAIWSKFALNCALNPLSCLTGLRPGEVIRQDQMSALLDTVIEEILAVIKAGGVTLPEADPACHIREHAFLRYNRPSMLQHIEAGRRTEIAGLNGALIKHADALGVPVPVNRTIAALVKGLESRVMRGAAVDEGHLESLAAKEHAVVRSKPTGEHLNGGYS